MTIEREHLDKIDFSDVADGADLMPPVSPGEILREDFMEPLDLSANALAKALHVPPNRITAILDGTRSITADTAYGSRGASIRPPNPGSISRRTMSWR
jgi:hypothetical protein